MNKTPLPTILVIVGISGDLARRKLLPSIEQIAKAGALPEHFQIVGITRRDITVDDVLAPVSSSEPVAYNFIRQHLSMYKMNLEDRADYGKLQQHLTAMAAGFNNNNPVQTLFYLSVPPQVSQPIIQYLGESSLANDEHVKLLLEKPFGSDLQSAQELIAHITQFFKESQVYRIDHYLAKEMAQNILVFRQGNSLFKRTWNKDFIERIEIVASEKIGIEGRATFYEQTGALRDIVQSHLLQLAALTLLDLPEGYDWRSIPSRRLRALEALVPPAAEHIDKQVKRGQYKGYDQEISNPHTETETFVSLTLHSRDPRWEGVPVVLATGKNLEAKYTEVRIHYRLAQETEHEANELTLRIQPNEGIRFAMWSKRPGYSHEVDCVNLQFSYHEQAGLPQEAYEQVFLNAIHSDHALFTSSDEVLAAWRILEPILQHWSMGREDLLTYEPGTDINTLF